MLVLNSFIHSPPFFLYTSDHLPFHSSPLFLFLNYSFYFSSPPQHLNEPGFNVTPVQSSRSLMGLTASIITAASAADATTTVNKSKPSSTTTSTSSSYSQFPSAAPASGNLASFAHTAQHYGASSASTAAPPLPPSQPPSHLSQFSFPSSTHVPPTASFNPSPVASSSDMPPPQSLRGVPTGAGSWGYGGQQQQQQQQPHMVGAVGGRGEDKLGVSPPFTLFHFFSSNIYFYFFCTLY